MAFKAMDVHRKTGTEAFRTNGIDTAHTITGYWAWAHSDLVDNAERGKVAEYIVAMALGVAEGFSPTWGRFDLTFKGKGIEVKSSAYMQTWYQEKESSILFGCRPTFGWDEATNTNDTICKRQAHIYVFCVLTPKDKSILDPLDLDQWQFYVVPTAFLDEKIPKQKTISMLFLQKHGIAPCTYDGIRPAVEHIVNAL